MEDAHESYIHEEEIRGLHVSMGNGNTQSNERRARKGLITMIDLDREVHNYRGDNEMIMKSREEILKTLNILYK
jgi:hypothetical protein